MSSAPNLPGTERVDEPPTQAVGVGRSREEWDGVTCLDCSAPLPRSAFLRCRSCALARLADHDQHPGHGTEPPVVEVAGDDDVRAAVEHELAAAGVTLEDLVRQARSSVFVSERARPAWFAISPFVSV